MIDKRERKKKCTFIFTSLKSQENDDALGKKWINNFWLRYEFLC